MKLLLVLAVSLQLLYATDLYEDIYANEAYKMAKNKEAILVDVRTTIEFIYTGHGEGFINIPYTNWIYEPKSVDKRVQSALYELDKSKVKTHGQVQKLYNAKEVLNKNFVKEVMQAMKLANVNKVVLICRSGPRAKAAANALAREGITAYNLEDGFIFGWKEESMPWGGY